ncbi:MAG: PAS domain S-box protein, partial [Planctomycetota bacterium]
MAVASPQAAGPSHARRRPALPVPTRPVRLDDESRLVREVFLLFFCAVFAAAVFLLWRWARGVWLDGLDAQSLRIAENLKDLGGPFLTAYVAARLYSSMVRRRERQMTGHRNLLAHILDESVDAIVTIDADERISTWNRGATQIFGYTEEEVVGRPVADLFPSPEEASKELTRIREA